MNKKTTDFDLCCQCGWLGLCVVACPLAAPARGTRLESTHPDIEIAGADEAFEIVVGTDDGSNFRPGEPPAPKSF